MRGHLDQVVKEVSFIAPHLVETLFLVSKNLNLPLGDFLLFVKLEESCTGVPRAALTLALVQATILSDLIIPPTLICSRLASRIREDPGRSLRKPSTRDVSLRFIVTLKGMNRYHLLARHCLH